ncbi:unnamed protein product [Lathyrus oleraceus]
MLTERGNWGSHWGRPGRLMNGEDASLLCFCSMRKSAAKKRLILDDMPGRLLTWFAYDFAS